LKHVKHKIQMGIYWYIHLSYYFADFAELFFVNLHYLLISLYCIHLLILRNFLFGCNI